MSGEHYFRIKESKTWIKSIHRYDLISKTFVVVVILLKSILFWFYVLVEAVQQINLTEDPVHGQFLQRMTWQLRGMVGAQLDNPGTKDSRQVAVLKAITTCICYVLCKECIWFIVSFKKKKNH